MRYFKPLATAALVASLMGTAAHAETLRYAFQGTLNQLDPYTLNETFKEVGCTACHVGVNVGGTMYQKMGLVQDYFELRGGEITEADLGRFNVTGEESHRHLFKVPTLRNVADTAPYFHDGSQEDLAEAVRIMGQVQLGKELEDQQVSDIVAFLESLSGELPEHARLSEDEQPPSRATGDAASEATYFICNHNDNHVVRSLRCIWHNVRKQWYVPAGLSLAPFAKATLDAVLGCWCRFVKSFL